MNWYKISQRKDVLGRPIPDWGGKTVYHATDEEGFEDMKENGYRFWDMDEQSGYYGNAVHFAVDPSYAESFGSIVTIAKLVPDIKILNMNDKNDFPIFQNAVKNLSGNQWRDAIISLGYDGVYDPGAGDLALYKPEKAIFQGILE